MYAEHDPKVLAVLERALRSGSRPTRLRAVAMLARVDCDSRARWLARAAEDPDRAVRETATIVSAWTCAEPAPDWPDREDPVFDRLAALDAVADEFERVLHPTWQWEYTLEVWREDGLLVGVFAATVDLEDDEHAKRMALGQAILASAMPTGDRFNPESAAAFIVAKRRVPVDGHPRRTR